MRTDEMLSDLALAAESGALAKNWALTLTEAAAEIRRLSGLVERAAASFAPIFAHLDNPPGAPGHTHRVPGIWDDDVSNGDRAGKPCEWCAQWEVARATLAEMGA